MATPFRLRLPPEILLVRILLSHKASYQPPHFDVGDVALPDYRIQRVN